MGDDEVFPFVLVSERPSGREDHGELSGLEDDDHPQYLLASGIRAMTGDLIPDEDNLRRLGNSDRRWSNIYAVNAHFENLENLGISIDGGEISDHLEPAEYPMPDVDGGEI